VTVFDKSARQDGTFSRDDLTYDHARDLYLCPDGKKLITTDTLVNDSTAPANTIARDALSSSSVVRIPRTEGAALHPRKRTRHGATDC
jgi:hypothetical protein